MTDTLSSRLLTAAVQVLGYLLQAQHPLPPPQFVDFLLIPLCSLSYHLAMYYPCEFSNGAVP
jgi:hypothetical protein